MERYYTASPDKPYVSLNYEDAVISPAVCTHCGYMLRHQADTLSQEDSVYPDYSLTIVNDRRLAKVYDTDACALCSYVRSLIPWIRRWRGINGSVQLRLCHDESQRTLAEPALKCSPNDALRGRLGFYLRPERACNADDDENIPLYVGNEATSPQICFWRSNITETSVKRLDSARKWLKDCRESHPQCQNWRVQRTRRRPSRLLKIEGATVKLRTCEQDDQVQYVALSHCWGTASDVQPLKTERFNVRQHSEDGIAIASLPSTFRDALITTHELGIEYLWIDSLCIIQDDLDDWQHQAAIMADIYESAELTVLASWATNSTDGCFSEYVRPVSFELRMPEDKQMEVCSDPLHLVVRARVDFGNLTPLSLRKWALQEYVLSLRRLEFLETQMKWSCATTNMNEGDTPMDQGITNLAASLLTPGSANSMNQYESDSAWHALVYGYSRRFITSASDKLAAFAGICRMFESLSDDKIVVGLRQSRLSHDVLWRSWFTRDAKHGKIDRSAIAALNLPSWSWMKSDKRIMTTTESQLDVKDLFMVLNTDIRWTGVPMTSRIVHAGLTVLGKVLSITAIYRREGDTCMCIADRAELCLPTGVIIPVHFERWQADDCVDAFPRDISCLLIGHNGGPTFYGKYFYALLIMLKDDDTTSHFVRVGVTEVHGISDDHLDQIPMREIVLV